jgi:asparagine synthase (glutamine-hydrolysing)
MCGIVGALAASSPDRDAALDAACTAMAHRGPDGRGAWLDADVALGHTRLAIIDRTARSDQPMVDDRTGCVLVFNGEIYNYRELRTELRGHGHEFVSDGDTEVLLRSYLEWGERCVDRLNGMFAFGLWDPRCHRLFAARDRLGEKPLHVVTRGGDVWFASEIKALLAAGVLSPRTEPDELYRYLTLADLGHPSLTPFAGVVQLPAAHAGWIIPDGEVRFAPYWTPPTLTANDPVSVDELTELWQDAVRLRLRSDVPVGTSLSGGLDSTTVLATVRSLEPEAEMHAFTASFPGTPVDELPQARRTAASLGVTVHAVPLGAEDLVKHLDDVVSANESPVEAPSVLAQFRVMQAARDAGIVVLLDGQGGDEVFRGYDKYLGAHVLDLAATLQPIRARRLTSQWQAGYARPIHLPYARVAALASGKAGRRTLTRAAGGASHRWLAADYRRAHAGTDPVVGDPFPPVRPGRWAVAMPRQDLVRVTLPRLIRYGDRMSMAASREVRLPYLDHRLVERATAIPARQSFEDGWTKAPLRHILDRLGRSEVAWSRVKRNFMPPQAEWLDAPNARELVREAWRAGHRAGVLADPEPVAGVGPRFRVLSTWRWMESFGTAW